MTRLKAISPAADQLYFSARLRERLRGAIPARGLVIEAPSGYGKTTIAQDWLQKHLPQRAIWVRHVGAEETPAAAWRRLASTLAKVDLAGGESLMRLGPPDEDNLGEIETLFRELECARPTWLVVDDFHQVASLGPASLWAALLEHDCPLLHTVLLTRPLGQSVMPYEKSGQLRLGLDDLRLTAEESGEYFAAAGLPLSEEFSREIHRRTDGWVMALALHRRHYRNSGRFAPPSGLEGLLRKVIWDQLDEAVRDFLLRLSPFETFSPRQAVFLTGSPARTAEAAAALRGEAFLRFDPADGSYYPHRALLDFTRDLFAELPEKTRREIMGRAGEWCASNGEREKAIAFYYSLRDFEKILALELSGLEDNRLMELSDLAYVEALRDIVAHLTGEMKSRYPMSVIQLAFEFFGQGCFKDFADLRLEMEDLVERGDWPEAEKNNLRGELRLMDAFSHFNRIADMGRRMKEAAELTGGRTSLISPHNSWTFGSPSVLLMYHSQTGRLDGELADMEFFAPYYISMARGHGSGGPALMRAEARLNRGELSQAEIFGHQARYEAGTNRQTSVLIGVELLFGRLALLRGDGPALTAALEIIGRLAEDAPKSNRMEADLARSFLLTRLERPAEVAEWLRQGSPTDLARRLFLQAMPFAHLCRAGYLLLAGKPEILLGEVGAALELAEALGYPLAQLYFRLQSAAARLRLGDRAGALADLRAALELAQPDGLRLPLAEYYQALNPLWADLPETPPGLPALAEQLAAGRLAVERARRAGNPLGLSGREYETARLAAEGLPSQAIADRLEVTIHTVKAHLKAVYRKTGAKNRLGLRKILLKQVLL